MDIPKTYLYKISRNGLFLGVLENVNPPFYYGLDLNSAATQLTLTVAQSVDRSQEPVDILETESGDPLQTESGETLTIERQPDIVGNTNPNALIRNNNDIEVIEFSSRYPNGHTVFLGYISKWKAVFGGNDLINVTCISYGIELDNYLIQGALTVDQSQVNQTDSLRLYSSATFGSGWQRAGQTFQVGVGVTNIKGFRFRLAHETGLQTTCTVKLWNNSGEYYSGGTPLATTSRLISDLTPAVYDFEFSAAVPVTPGQTYFVSVNNEASDISGILIYYQASNAYANGAMEVSQYAGGSGGGGWAPTPVGSIPASDLYFQTLYTAGATSSPYVAEDPSDILRSVLDSYNSRGGVVTYDGSSIEDTLTAISYTFKVNTVLEGINKILNLAPANWYWTVDPATNLLSFKETNTTPDHIMVKGQHIESLEIEATVEEVRNIVYFTGGDTGGGSNLFILATDSDSLNENRPGLARITDNRVTLEATGNAIAQNFLDENTDEKYITVLIITDETYDISLFKPGETIGFAGFGSWVDDLVLQIARLERGTDQAVLKLGVLKQRASSTVESINRSLNETNTVNNPSVPS